MTFNTNFLNSSTDLGIAAVALHEMMHAYLTQVLEIPVNRSHFLNSLNILYAMSKCVVEHEINKNV